MSKLFHQFASHSLALLAIAFGFGTISAETTVEWHASLTAQASSESLAPYMLGSWNDGRYVEGSGIWQEAGLSKSIDMNKRFSWGAGIDYIAGAGSKTAYDRWNGDTKTWTTNKDHLPYFRLQQIFAEVKYRGVFLNVGMKQNHSLIIDDHLSSGDVVRSNNFIPIPGFAIGFIDFQNIPFTKGWVQIEGQIMYGKMTDSNFKKNMFNYYSGTEALDLYYNYKRCYFRTNPDKPFHVIVGMQAAGMFGGWTKRYAGGKVFYTEERGFKVKDMFQMLFPHEDGGEAYYTGQHLGSWDFKATYRFRNGSQLSAYFEWPWEDGSGIGRMNGWDGLWGVQYNFAKSGIISKAVVEFLDFTNQSGPIHYDPADNPESSMTGHAQGADNYYNNDFYGPYSNYGMSIGTPFLISPVYNRNGMPAFLHNRARGFHAAVEGNPCPRLSYRAMVGYQTAGGSGWVPAPKRLHSTSAMIEAKGTPFRKIPEMTVGLKLAFDAGELRGDNFGASISVAYNGNFNF